MKKVTENIIKMLNDDQIQVTLEYYIEHWPTDPMTEVLRKEELLRAEREIAAETRRKQLETEKKERLATKNAQVDDIFKLFEGRGKMSVMVDAFEEAGHEYRNGYEICDITFIVTSLVAHEHQNNIHECKSMVHAIARVNELCYKRLWDKYVYRGTEDSYEEFMDVARSFAEKLAS